MKITSQQNDQYTLMSLKGELTADEVDDFRKKSLEQMNERTHDFVLEMSQVPFVDSQGLETLLWLQDQCIENLAQVRLAACPENVKTILTITRLAETLVACDDVDQAIQSLNA